MRLVTIAILLFCFCFWCATATFFVADIGTESVKLAVPRDLRIDLCLNEMSERKSPNFIGFRNLLPTTTTTGEENVTSFEERSFGSDAKNLLPRFPTSMIPSVVRWIGVSCRGSSDDNDALSSSELWNQKLAAEGYTFEVRCNDSTNELDVLMPTVRPNVQRSMSMRELFAMQVGNWKATVEKCLSGPARDSIFVVPSYVDATQRIAMIDAAALAGVRVLDVLHTTTAVSLQLAYQSFTTGITKASKVLIVDVGATHSEAAVYSFQPPAPSATAKSQSLGSIVLLGSVQSNATLGSRSFDVCIAKYLEDEFVAKTNLPRVLGGTSLADKKAVVSLMRAANMAKEMLSANQEAPVTVEGIAPSRDFTTTLSRATLERVCRPVADQIVALRDAALESAAVPLSMVERMEVFGGGVRVPLVAQALAEGYRRDQVDRTLNTDESAVLGAGSYAAILTGHLRMRGFLTVDRSPWAASVLIERNAGNGDGQPTLSNTKCVHSELWAQGAVLPIRRSVTVRVGRIPGVFFDEEERRSANLSTSLLPNATWTARILVHNVSIDSGAVHGSDAATEIAVMEAFRSWRSRNRRLNVTHVDVSLAFSVFGSQGSVVHIEDVELKLVVHSLKRIRNKANRTALSNDTNTSASNNETDESAPTADSTTASAAEEVDNSTTSEAASEAAVGEASEPSDSNKGPVAAKQPEITYSFVPQVNELTAPLTVQPNLNNVSNCGTEWTVGARLTAAEALISRAHVEYWRNREAEASAISAARNEFESYLILARGEGFVANDTVKAAISPAVHAAIESELNALADWFDEVNEETAKASTYLAELNKMKKRIRLALNPNEKVVEEGKEEEQERQSGASTGGEDDEFVAADEQDDNDDDESEL